MEESPSCLFNENSQSCGALLLTHQKGLYRNVRAQHLTYSKPDETNYRKYKINK